MTTAAIAAIAAKTGKKFGGPNPGKAGGLAPVAPTIPAGTLSRRSMDMRVESMMNEKFFPMSGDAGKSVADALSLKIFGALGENGDDPEGETKKIFKIKTASSKKGIRRETTKKIR
ncbi:MAG: hypothetical protein LBF41_10260 [Deltaproteobacteria bacterium]|jgi:hypothetical protein|nr:hypothetical protein [Deltaproteobacteria bacterium]